MASEDIKDLDFGNALAAIDIKDLTDLKRFA